LFLKELGTNKKEGPLELNKKRSTCWRRGQ